MIAVIADDLTGAAELGGIGLRYGLVTEITSRVDIKSKADLIIIATDTRSLQKEAAELMLEQVCRDLHRSKPDLIFKKIDSVLRGHILAEITIQKNILHLKKALIVAGNPHLGRTIVGGTYLLNGNPVHLSSFSNDPEFPIMSSDVHEMLHADADEISIVKSHEEMPETGIIVGEVQDAADLEAWCAKIEDDTLIAGASGFFTAILEHFCVKKKSNANLAARMELPVLMICGSSFQKNYIFIEKMQQTGVPVSYVPADIVSNAKVNKPVFDRWVDETVHYLRAAGKAIVAINPWITGNFDALTLRTIMADATALITKRFCVNECLIDGGSTSAAVVRKLGIDTLYPEEELAAGVVRMGVKAEALHITIKPGSYDWPSFIMPVDVKKGSYEIKCIAAL